ncbi:amino acid adenylation domain-containing protein [Pseudoalteromonas rhizosphaerae]|uniref:Amino acid adenylation domain-containing protein n=1 Tax=Pseudoalteromonas rhizosphaerae TaxID=2518973 RepID=A0ABW8L1C3_9GAMM
MSITNLYKARFSCIYTGFCNESELERRLCLFTSKHDAFAPDLIAEQGRKSQLSPYTLHFRSISCESTINIDKEQLLTTTERVSSVIAVGVLKLSENEFWLTVCAPNYCADLYTLQLSVKYLLTAEFDEMLDEEVVQFSEVTDWLDGIALDPDKPQLTELVSTELLEEQVKQRLRIEDYIEQEQCNLITRCLDLKDYRARITELAHYFDISTEMLLSAAIKLAIRRFNDLAQITSLVSLREDDELSLVAGNLLSALPISIGEVDSLSEVVDAERMGRELLGSIAECFYTERQIPYLHTYYYFQADLNNQFTQTDVTYLHDGGALTHVLLECDRELKLCTTFTSKRFTPDAIDLLHKSLASVLEIDLGSELSCQLRGVEMARPINLQSWVEQSASCFSKTQIIQPGSSSCSLSQLNEQANRLANYLLEQGIKKGSRVLLWETRSIEFFVAMLATTKLGATYVPLNESMPLLRVEEITEQLDATMIITSLHTQSRIASATCLNLHELNLTHYSSSTVQPEVVDSDIAYIIFTSGSTGEPKGIKVSYGALINHMQWFEQAFSVGAQDTLLQKTSAGFDASIWEFWVVVLSGVNCVIAEQSATYDIGAFMHLLKEYDITLLQVVPSYLTVLTEHTDFSSEQLAIRTLFCGGEALPSSSANKAKSKLGCKLVNLYGPTETCIDATYYVVEQPLLCDTVPIGHPIANLTCKVLDNDNKPVVLGGYGELVVSGYSLFSGYLDNQQATASATYVDETGVAYYRTGDIVSVMADGNLYYIGRKDNQIKHNGYRIDLDAVSSIATHCEFVSKAECVYSDTKNRLTLVYKAQKAGLSDENLKSYLEGVLPAFMIPEHFIAIDAFPVTVNGKVDRKALVALAEKHDRREYQAPTTELEILLVQVWEKELALSEKVSLNDNFFSLGGDSIKGIKVAYELNRRGLNLSLLTVFENPTIQALAKAIQLQTEMESSHKNILPVGAVPDILLQQYREVYPVTGMQNYMLSQYELDTLRARVFHPQEVIELPSEIADFSKLSLALEYELQNVNFRTRFVEYDGQLFQFVVDSTTPHIEKFVVSGRVGRGEMVTELLRRDSQQPFNWKDITQPLIRFYYIADTQGGASLITSNLHAIQDGWGNVTFKNNVEQRLLGLRTASKESIVNQPNVLKEFVAQELNEMIEPSKTISYWQSKVPEFTSSRLQKQSPNKQQVDSFTGQTSLKEGLNWAKAHSVHFKSVLIAALSCVLKKNLGEPWATLGLVSNGRNPALSEPLESLGLFWNLLPFRLSDSTTLSAMVQQAHTQLIDMEPAIRLPLTHQIAMHDGLVPFRVTFNYVEFHHHTVRAGEEQYRIKETSTSNQLIHRPFTGQDYFGFPLELSFSVQKETFTWVVQYDINNVSREAAQGVIADLIFVIQQEFRK